jgi:hypothetical protein
LVYHPIARFPKHRFSIRGFPKKSASFPSKSDIKSMQIRTEIAAIYIPSGKRLQFANWFQSPSLRTVKINELSMGHGFQFAVSEMKPGKPPIYGD